MEALLKDQQLQLLLGLQLINKSLKGPTRPQLESNSSGEESETSPSPPGALRESSRKRKLPSDMESSHDDKKEKR